MIEEFQEELNKVLKELEERLRTIRSHHLTRDFLENLEIEIYHSKYLLKSLGLISQIDPLSFRFEPFDSNSLSEIETSIRNRKMSLTIIKEKNSLIIKFPPLTEEFKKEILKTLSQIKEETRIRSRLIRDEFLKNLKNKKERSEISEDMFFKIKEKVDKETEFFNQKVNKILEQKEKEILQ